MSELKLVINDTKKGKSYSKSMNIDLIGKKIGEKLNGSLLGLKDYELEITGGSDIAGFPMRKDIEGQVRKSALLSSGPGVKIKRKGMRLKKTIHGNTIGNQIIQVNLKITKYGSVSLEKVLVVEKKEEK